MDKQLRAGSAGDAGRLFASRVVGRAYHRDRARPALNPSRDPAQLCDEVSQDTPPASCMVF